MKKVIGALILGVMFVFGIAGTGFALTYQDSSDIQFTFNSTLSISLSNSDIVIGNLIPGQDDTSNVVDVVVNTNNIYGYTLTATVGSATKDYRDLRHTNGVANFASIDVNSDLTTLSGQSSSVWGYAISTNGTTWSNFNGLPKYDDTTNTAELNVTDGAAADSTTSFKIGAYAAEGQLAGDYTNVINFKVVSNGAPETRLYLQDVTASQCTTTPITVYDSRDEEPYVIGRLDDGECWILENLRLGGDESILLTPNDTNIASNFTLPIGRSQGNDTSYTMPIVDIYVKDITAGYHSGVSKAGNFYNYCAASAGTYCYAENSGVGDAQYDVCPKGWRMPTGGSNGEIKALLDAYDADDSIDNYVFMDAFRFALSGDGGGLNSRFGSTAYIWSASAEDGEYMYGLTGTFDYSPGDMVYIYSDWSQSRSEIQSVRCLLK